MWNEITIKLACETLLKVKNAQNNTITQVPFICHGHNSQLFLGVQTVKEMNLIMVNAESLLLTL